MTIHNNPLRSPQELWNSHQQQNQASKISLPNPQLTPPQKLAINGLSGSVTDLYSKLNQGSNQGQALPNISLLPLTPSQKPEAPAAPLKIYQRSKHHDAKAFVPNYSITAYHESGEYRSKKDPYAVGAISKPSRSQDLGGKTYGTYQFESYVYKNGDRNKDSLVNGSTLMRFLRSKKNPYGPQLLAIAKSKGIASSAFDNAWKNLAETQNKNFGLAQQSFLQEDKFETVNKFFDNADVSAEARKNPELFDLIVGTTNQFDSLADGMAKHIKNVQKRKGKPLSAKQIGVELSNYKLGRVTSLFRSSPKAWNGVRNRFKAERAIFQ